jgi:hypothetical protein
VNTNIRFIIGQFKPKHWGDGTKLRKFEVAMQSKIPPVTSFPSSSPIKSKPRALRVQLWPPSHPITNFAWMISVVPSFPLTLRSLTNIRRRIRGDSCRTRLSVRVSARIR